ATNEMKTRVVETLVQISEGIVKPEFQSCIEFLKEKNNWSSDRIWQQAKMLLTNILHGYSFFAFSTIDSFVVRLVRAFAFDLRLPLNFGIELNTNIIIEEAVSALINNAGYDAQLTDFLIHYVENLADDERSTDINKAISELASVLFNDKYADFVESLKGIHSSDFFKYSKDIVAKVQIEKNLLKSLGNEALAIISEAGLSESDFYQSSRGIAKYFENVALAIPDRLAPNSFVLKTIEQDQWFGAKCSAATIHKIESVKEKLVEIFHRIQSRAESYVSILLIRRNVEAVALLKYIQDLIEIYYSENGVIHLSETLKKVNEIVQNEQAPFIYERIGNRYSHYMIDEFQDTSVRQWHNLLPLLDESLANNNYNLVVGDAKQSIYRWRGGNYNQFIDLPEVPQENLSQIIKNRAVVLRQNYQETILDTNYRSAKIIVQFNNEFYGFCLAKFAHNEILTKVFRDYSQNLFSKKTGYVELNFVKTMRENPDQLKNNLLSIISDLQSRNIPFKNMAILARKNSQLQLIAQWLIDKGLPVISSQSLRLGSSPNVQFVVSFLRFLSNPADKIALLFVVEHLLENNFLDEKTALNYLIGYKTVSDLLQLINLSPALLQTDDSMQIAETIINHFGLMKNDYAFMVQLLDFVHKSQQKMGVGVAYFVEYFDLYSADEYVAMPDNIDAINLITIHKSKGLEFKYLVFVDFNSKKRNADHLTVSLEKIGIKKPILTLIPDVELVLQSVFKEEKMESKKLEESDQLNLLYVATTRAKQELYIISEDKSSSNSLLKEFAETNASFVKSDDYEDEVSFVCGEKIVEEMPVQSQDRNVLQYDYFKSWNSRVVVNHRHLIGEIGAKTTSQKIGTVLHSVFEHLQNPTKSDDVIDRLEQIGIILPEEIDFFKELVKKLLLNQDIKELFSAKNLYEAERTIIHKSGRILRPDRVVFEPNRLKVIDYKYSNKTEISPEQLQEYHQQITDYKDVLQQMYPNQLVEGYLLWIKNEIALEKIV
ncbi:MAG: UvrD-helicase domain-containing protein, partial [Bacteroidales bacterium]|nr:UvrD-helicase domain-containing protein [Bacteroidales bacterium]